MTSTLQSHGPLLQEDSAIMGVPALQRGSCIRVRIRQTKQLASQAPDVHKLTSRSLRSVPQLGDMMGQTFGLSGKDVLHVTSPFKHSPPLCDLSLSPHSNIWARELGASDSSRHLAGWFLHFYL